MSFAFETDDGNVERGLRRIAIEQIHKALLEASAPQAEFDATVHQLRRRCKNLRGLLRIVRPQLKAFKLEDAAIADAASQLSQARDAAVMVATFDSLMAEKPDADGREQLRDMLTERSQALAQHVDEQALLAKFCEAVLAMRERVGDWRLKRKKFGAIAGGVEDTYRRMRQSMRDAAEDGSPETLHAWRKQAKYHRHHMLLLRRHAPDMLDGRSKLLAELADLLGRHHDLAVLVEVLSGRVAGAPAALNSVVELANERQHGLGEQAFALGRQIAAEKPGALTERLQRYWALEDA
ncbi:CHAD domain-containing protein [Devosia sp. UYZn731]|uniref:CHAD domain-containing protein n=1 Tax=Devosia sp. UYZn731 TaxID=3156345 RepID=UPI00339A2AD0